MMTIRKTAVAVAVSAAMGTAAGPAAADLVYADWTGVFTLLQPDGAALLNGDAVSGGPWYQLRTAIYGTFIFDTDTGAGTGNITPFSFFGSGPAVATSVSMQAIGDGMGGPGTLVLGNMGFNWSGNNGIPVSIVLDAAGFFGAFAGGIATSDTISGTGALAASDNTLFNFGKVSYTLPIGPAPMVTTTWNTSDVGTITLGTNPSGTLPLIADTATDVTNGDIGVGGSPMKAGPFPNFNANFDVTWMHISSPPDPPYVPLPPAVWLFGSGLLGLLGAARRRRPE